MYLNFKKYVKFYYSYNFLFIYWALNPQSDLANKPILYFSILTELCADAVAVSDPNFKH